MFRVLKPPRPKIKIFSCHHERPFHRASGDLFVPIWTGGQQDVRQGILSDLNGTNIHHEVDFCEMRQQYYIWKNCLGSLDYVGFEQYRRRFLIDPSPASVLSSKFPRLLEIRRKMECNLRVYTYSADSLEFADFIEQRLSFSFEMLEAIRGWIGAFDIIVPRPHLEENLKDQWLSNEPSYLYDYLIDSVKAVGFASSEAVEVDFNHQRNSFNNMYIMNARLFGEYMEFWWSVMKLLKPRVQARPRMCAILSERLFSFWLLKKRIERPLLKICELPHLIGTDFVGSIAELNARDGLFGVADVVQGL